MEFESPLGRCGVTAPAPLAAGVHDAVQAVPGAAQITEAVVAAARCDPAPKLRAQATELVGRLRLLCAGAKVARNAISELLPELVSEKPSSFRLSTGSMDREILATPLPGPYRPG